MSSHRIFIKEELAAKLYYCFEMALFYRRVRLAESLFAGSCCESVLQMQALIDDMAEQGKIFLARGEQLINEGTDEFSPQAIAIYVSAELIDYEVVVKQVIDTDPDLPSAIDLMSRQICQCIKTIPKDKNPTMP